MKPDANPSFEKFIEASRNLGKLISVENVSGNEKPYTNAVLDAIRNEGLMSVVVPPSMGGPGLDLHSIAKINFNIARVSASAALIYAMHMSQAYCIVQHDNQSAFFDDLQRRMVRDQLLIGSATSEKGVGGDIFGSVCEIAPSADGRILLKKDCPIISYFELCGAVLITAMDKRSGGKPKQVLIAAESKDIEFVQGPEMQLTGLRGIVNRAYELNVRCDPEAIFSEGFVKIQRDTMTPVVNILWATVWSGIAWQAIDRLKRAVAKEGKSDATSIVAFRMSALIDKHYVMNAIIRDSINEYQKLGRSQDIVKGMSFSARSARLKVVGADLLNDIVRGALDLIGMRGYALDGSYSLSELVRDALSAPLMVSNLRLTLRNSKIERYVDEVL